MKLRSILMLILASMAFGTVACGNTDTNDPDEKKDEKKCKDGQTYNEQSKKCETKKKKGGDDNNKKQGGTKSNGPCAADPKPARCATTAPQAGAATKLTAISFPAEQNVGGKPNNLGAKFAGLKTANIVDVNAELKKAVDDEDIALVLEFSEWKQENAPTEKFPTFLWLGEKGKTTVKKPVGTVGFHSSSYLSGTNIVTNATVSTDKSKLVLPILLKGIEIKAEVVDAQLEGKVKYEADGVELTDAHLSGLVLKDSLMTSLKNVASVTCGECLKVDGDWFAKKDGVNDCSKAKYQNEDVSGICTTLEGTLMPLKDPVVDLFQDKYETEKDSTSVVINLAGTPFKISAIED